MSWNDTALNALFLAACSALSVLPESKQSATFFRKSWPTGTTNTSTDANVNVCYLRVYARDAVSLPVQTFYLPTDDALAVSQNALIPAGCQFIFYGPLSSDYATQLASQIYRDTPILVEGTLLLSPRQIMREAGIIPSGEMRTPIRSPELIDGIWYDRNDVTLDFDVQAEYAFNTAYIENGPTIKGVSNHD